jgi:uncharacterized repeat protein (TIGR01451 family)
VVVNDSSGRARFLGVTPGTRTVAENVPFGWTNFNTTPAGGVVQVSPGDQCSTVVFKNQQQQLVAQQPRLEIEKTDGKSKVEDGERLEYRITVTNESNIDATNVSVIDSLPDEVDFLDASDDGFRQGDEVRWNNLTIPANGRKVLEVEVRVDTDDCTRIRNRANIVGGPSDEDVDDVECEDDDLPPTIPLPPLLDLQLTKSVDRYEANPGDSLNYIITVQNAGNAELRNVLLEDQFDRSLFSPQNIDGSFPTPYGISWTIPVLQVGETRTITYTGTLSRSLRMGDVVPNTVTATVENLRRTARADVRILTLLPQTGLLSATTPLQDANNFLRPVSQDGSYPAIVILSVLLSLAGLSYEASRRFLIRP